MLEHEVAWGAALSWALSPLIGYLAGSWKGHPFIGFIAGLAWLPGVAFLLWVLPSSDVARARHLGQRKGTGVHVSAQQAWHEGPHQRGQHRQGGKHAR